MDDPQRERLGLLLEQVLALPREDRPRFIDEACGDDPALRDELTSLLAASESSADYFDALGEQVVLPALAAVADAGGTSPAGALGPGDVVAHYEIIERVGGGMGVVYRARDVTLGRTVALKFLPPALAADELARERLYAEARAASALDHPNIGAVYEIGEAERGGLYIAFAWCEGETLKQTLVRGPLPLADALATARQIAAALAAAHRAGIVHRDVKPSNIVRTPDGVVKLVDFGIAKIAGSDVTREGITLGTVAYMSPEQTRGKSVDARTDVWSLGVVLYEMLVGRRPFRGESDDAVIYAIRHDAPESVTHLRPDVSPAIASIVERCLTKDPAGRYADAGTLMAELEALGAADSTGELRRRGTTAGRSVPARGVGAVARRPQMRVAVAVLMIAVLAVVAALRFVDARDSGAAARAGISTSERPALAVLPFANRSGLAADQVITDGIHDEIRSRLSGVATLRVSSRTSVMQYRHQPKPVREIGRELGVDAVLEGAVQRVGDSVRVFVQLVDTRSDSPLWSDSYDHRLDMTGLFAIQREIATRVAEELRAELTDADRARVARMPTTDLEAYRHYQLGRHFWNQRDPAAMDSALAHFREAVRRDPLYARAYAGLADVHVLGYGPAGSDGYRLAIAAARNALRLDPDLAEAHSSLAFGLMVHAWDWAAAERSFRRAIELDPSYATAHEWYAELLASQGRLDEAVEEARIADALDPLSLIISWNMARILGLARRHDEAIEQLRRLDRRYPGVERVGAMLGIMLILTGRHSEGADAMARALEPRIQAADPQRATLLRTQVDSIGAGHMQAAISLLRDDDLTGTTGDGHQRMFEAIRMAMSGDMAGAVRFVEESYERRAFGLVIPDLVVGVSFDLFRDEPRFQAVLRRMGLDPEIGLRLRNQDPAWLATR